MKQTLRNLLVSLAVLLAAVASNVSVAQNAIIGSGFSTGWNNPGNITYPFSAGAGTSRIATFAGTNAGPRYWRMIRGWTGTGCFDGNNTEYGPVGNTDLQITTFGNIQPMGYTNGNGAWFVNDNANGHNFIIKTRDACASNDWTIFRVQGAVRNVATESLTPATVWPGQNMTFTATLNNTPSAGQGVYLRYSTDNFATSTVVEMTNSSGNNFTTTVTNAVAGATYRYYYFTSGAGLTITPANVDFYTINLNNNAGGNFSRTVQSAYTTTGSSTDWNNTAAWGAGIVPPAGQPVSLGHNITLTANQSVNNLTITAGTLTVNNGVTLTVATGSTLAVNGGALTLAAGSGITLSGTAALTIAGGTVNINSTSITLGTGGLNLNSGTLNANAATLNVPAGASFNRSGGTFNVGTSTVNFQGAGTIGGSTTTTFNNLTINTGEVTLSQTPTVNGILQINGGNFNSGGNVTYGSSSTLLYNGVTYGPFREWLAEADGAAGTGRPQNVELAGGAIVNLPTTTRALAGNLTICSTCSLNFNSSGDLMLRGSWTNNHTGNNVNYGSGNGRAVWFLGTSGTSVITKAGSSAQTFAYLLLNNTNTVQLASNVSIATTTGDVLQFNAAGTLDLNARTLTLSGAGGNILSNANYSVNGNTNSAFVIAANKSRSGTGTLTFGGSVAASVSSGATFTNNASSGNLTIGSTASLTFTGGVTNSSTITISGNLIRNGGTWSTTAPTYTATSTLIYETSVTIGTEWTQPNSGTVGLGRPQNLVVNATLTFAGTRSIVGNLTLGASGALTATNGVTLGMTGDVTDNNTSTSNLNNIGFEITANSPRSMTKASGAEFRPRSIINRGSSTLTINNNVRLAGSSPREFGCYPGPIVLNNATVTLDQTAAIVGHATNGFTGTNGVININAATTTSLGNAIFGNGVTVNINAATYTTHANGVQVNGTAALNVNNAGELRLAGAYVGNSPVYTDDAGLRYTGAVTIGPEWTATAYGTPTTGRPNRVFIASTVTTTATERACAFEFRVTSTGSLTMGSNPTLRIGGYYTDDNTGNGIPTNTNLEFNNSTAVLITKASGPVQLRAITVNGAGDVNNSTTPVQLSSDLVLTNTGRFIAESSLSFTGTGELRVTGASGGITSPNGATVTFSGNTTIPSSNTNTMVFGGNANFIINNGATLTIANATNFSTTGTVTVNTTGSLVANVAGTTYPANMVVNGTVTLAHDGGVAPSANWGTTGLLNITGVVNTAPSNLNQSIARFTWNTPAMADHIGLGANSPTNVSRIFRVNSTNGNILSLDVDRTYAGRLEVDNGRFAVSGPNKVGPANTLTVASTRLSHASGNGSQLLLGVSSTTGSLTTDTLEVNLSAGTLSSLVDDQYVISLGNTGTQTLSFRRFVQTGTTPGFMGSYQPGTGNATLAGHASGATISLEKANFLNIGSSFNALGTLAVNSALEGSFNFTGSAPVTFASGTYMGNTGSTTFNSGAHIIHSDLAGINTNNTGLIRSSGTRTYAADLVITYNGSSAGQAGTELAGQSWGLVINNTAGITLNTDFSLRSVTLNGPLNVGSNALSLSANTNITLNSGGTIGLASGSTMALTDNSSRTLPNNLFTGTTLSSILVNGGGTLTLNNQNLTVNGGVSLPNGKLIVPTGQTLTFGTSSTWPTESNSNYIQGTTIMAPRSVGSGTLNFMGMALASGPDNLGNVSVTRTSGAAGRITFNSRSGIDCSWNIEADNQPVGGRNLTLSWPSVWDNGRNMNQVKFWRRISPSDPWLSLGDFQNLSASNPRSITFNTDHFSDWTTSDNNNPLPVTFRRVSASRVGKTSVVNVTFTTDEEKNVSHYTLQRSADNAEWQNVTSIPAQAGTSNRYSIQDVNSTATQAWYYRIQNTDLDGAQSLSPVVLVNSQEGKGGVIALYPNPMRHELNLSLYSTAAGKALIRLVSADGKEAYGTAYDVTTGTTTLNLTDAGLRSLPAGVYAVLVTLPDGSLHQQRITKQ